MCDHWMPTIKLPMTLEQFRALPRHSAYRYEWLEGNAWLTPQAKHFHAMLDLRPMEVPADVKLRPAIASDFTDMIPLFAATFARIQPYGSLDEVTRRQAAEESLKRTYTGGDGPWIQRASFVAVGEKQAVGGIFATLLPDEDPTDYDSYYWYDPPPDDCIANRLGRPHLTWIFVDPLCAGNNVGSALLAAAVNGLLQLGFTQLLSTFMVGNDSSLLWHWRNGFRLLPHPTSRRLRKERRK
jgi:hypothetical protein